MNGGIEKRPHGQRFEEHSSDLERKLHEGLVQRRRIAVVRFVWDERPHPWNPEPWPDWTVQWLLDGRSRVPGESRVSRRLHDLSIAGFWRDATLGLLELSFDLYPKDASPLPLQAPRNAIRTGEPNQKAFAAASALLEAQAPPLSIDSFDGIVYWVDPPTTDWGAIDCPPEGKGASQRALLDQMLTYHAYAHEIGHVAGYQHPFGIADQKDPVYKDDYCVMGYDSKEYCPVPPVAEIDRLPHNPDLWLATRLASAANSYRCHRGFRESPMIRRVAVGTEEQVSLVALSRAQFGDPVLVAIESNAATFTIEYRTNSGWDVGIAPAVVVHSLDYRQVPAGLTEVRPSWFEGAIQAPWTDTYMAPDGSFALNVLSLAPDDRSALVKVGPG